MLQASESGAEISGTVRLAMADSLCTPLIVKSFSDFRAKYPNISLLVTTAGTGDLFRMLDHNDADVACTLDSHIYNTSYIISAEEKVGAHFVCSVNSPLASMEALTIQELLNHPFLLTEKGMSYRRILDEFLALHSLEIHPILEMGNADLICSLVAENAGISFLPDYVTESAVRTGRVVRLKIEGFECELWGQLIYRRDKWLSAPVQAVVSYFSQSTGNFLQDS
ncbi:MAG: LysR family transcriptional regulator substrate-binding protein [Lachnospiraceae bacterium]|nr:LysR family transcriptional regulator substrate-binding protein [Lachnospiraceae bacterium]